MGVIKSDFRRDSRPRLPSKSRSKSRYLLSFCALGAMSCLSHEALVPCESQTPLNYTDEWN